MKKFLLGTVGLLALGMAAPASAADMAVKARPPAPMMAPIYDWTGFYIGGNGGWGQSNSCLNFVDVFGFDFADGCRSRSGGLVGGQIGYRWQASQWVFGLEAQGDWADLSHTRVSPFDRFLCFSTRTKTDGIGLFTGQIGYAWNQALFYVKGGAAVTSNRFSILETFSALNWPRPARPAGAAPSVLDLSTASHRTGRSVLNTTTCSWAMPIIRSRASVCLPPLLSTTGSPKTWIWSPCASTTASAVTARRSQRDTDLALFQLSSKLGRQKCRPFCWRLHV